MKVNQIFNRNTNRMESENPVNNEGLSFLYNTLPGKVLTNTFLNKRLISILYGKYVKSSVSVSKIPEFIKQYNINLSEVMAPVDSFKTLNDFFIRKLKGKARPIDQDSGHLISPADSRLLVFNLSQKNSLPLKGYWYSLQELILDGTLTNEYADGWCFVYRLSPSDYHRFCYIDQGYQDKVTRIKGVLHSVNPIALSAVKSLLSKNYRELTILHTANFDKVLHLEIGALLVGKVVQQHRDNYKFKRGEEKGWFEFGGSTIVQLFKRNAIIPDNDILEHSANHIETLVKMGERVGLRSNPE
jgi:phosphatidylserine decarboxylase